MTAYIRELGKMILDQEGKLAFIPNTPEDEALFRAGFQNTWSSALSRVAAKVVEK